MCSGISKFLARSCALKNFFEQSKRSASTALPNLLHTETSGGLEELRAWAYFDNPLVGLGVHHFASGKFIKKISESQYVVNMDDVYLSPIAEVSSRVYIKVGQTENYLGRIIGGIVAKINSNGTIGILLDNDTFEAQVSPGDVYLMKGRSTFRLENRYQKILEWVRDAGVRRLADQERICAVLYHRGWNVDLLYMLQPQHVHCMAYVKKSDRMSVLEKVEWQRAHHAEMRTLLREKVRERELRYFIQKYSGFVSANWAGLGVLSVFLWQYKNFRKSQRSFQLQHAVMTLTKNDRDNSTAHRWGHGEQKDQFVDRPEEEKWVQQIIRCMDLSRPRISIITGRRGCGKSTLFKAVTKKEKKPVLFVEVRGKEDTLSSVLRSLKVPSVDACADPLDFITDTFHEVKKKLGEPPMLVLVLREGSELSRVYNESVVLACDRNLCHLVFEVALEDLTHSNINLPRTDFYRVPNFNRHQAMQYTLHKVDPLSMHHFIQAVGTNSDDIDDLFSSMHHRKVSVCDYIQQKLSKAIRLMHSAVGNDRELYEMLQLLAKESFNDGILVSPTNMKLGDPALREIVLHDALLDRWMFSRHIFYSAARCIGDPK